MIVTVAELDDDLEVIGPTFTITVVEGSTSGGGGGGAVDSVNGQTGVVVLDATDVGADASGAAAAAQAASQPVDSDLTAIAALTTTSFGRALLALADAAAGRTALGLGTAAVAATGDFDAAGAAASAQAASQPLDSDLTAIAALTTTSYGRAFLALADAAAARTAIGVDATGTAVLKTLYDANSLLYATTDDTPVALTVAASRIVGRKASGDIVALTAAELRAILGSGTLDSTTVLHGDGTWSAVSGGSGGTSIRKMRTAGDVNVSNTQTAIDTSKDIVFAAGVLVAGSVIDVGASGSWAATGGNFGILDVATRVSSANVNWISNESGTAATYGVAAWIAGPSTRTSVGGSVPYTIQAGDIAGDGTVTLRIFGRCDAVDTKTMSASTAVPFVWWARKTG